MPGAVFLLANDVPIIGNELTAVKKAKRRGLLLSSIGADTYTLLKDLVAPQKPTDMSYSDLKAALAKHLKPKRFIIAEHFRLHTRM